LALERRLPTRLALELCGLGFDERRREQRAAELIDLMGLGVHRDKRVGELSTGTRRVTELACLLALEPSLLLLDEPTSGIAQRETEALGQLLEQVKAHLGTTMVIIEHDIPLIMGISDRIVAMAAGQVLTTGTPAEVRAHPGVIESYLGSSLEAIERSGPGLPQPEVATGPGGAARPITAERRRTPASIARCSAVTRSGKPCSRAAVDDDLCAQHAQLVGARG
jgi:ABC-type multidrug transport system ATPase subunit